MPTERYGEFEWDSAKAAKNREKHGVAIERYDWSKARRGRYAARFPRTANAVVIEPELYAYFGSAQRINEALSLIVRIEALVKMERAAKTRASATTKSKRKGKAA